MFTLASLVLIWRGRRLAGGKQTSRNTRAGSSGHDGAMSCGAHFSLDCQQHLLSATRAVLRDRQEWVGDVKDR